MLPSAVYILGIVGGLVLSGLGALSQKMTDKEITTKGIGRDFIAGTIIVLVLGFFIPDTFKEVSNLLPSMPSMPSFPGNGGDLELQVDPRM